MIFQSVNDIWVLIAWQLLRNLHCSEALPVKFEYLAIELIGSFLLIIYTIRRREKDARAEANSAPECPHRIAERRAPHSGVLVGRTESLVSVRYRREK